MVASSHRRQDAWLLAHKLISLARGLEQLADADQLHVTTQELCRAMGRPDGAQLEQVQVFARDVAELMDGYGLDTACGCGYLAFTIGCTGAVERALAEGREPRIYTPADLNQAFDAWLHGQRADGSSAAAGPSCPTAPR